MAMATTIGEWARGPTIGRGSSATVSLAVDRRTGATFAVKSVDDARASEGELRREQRILLALAGSPHVVRCLGMSASGRDLFLEYAPGGSLADEIKRRRCEQEERVIRPRARDILVGLAHVHAAGVAHCDVKARNVLIGADGRALLADFGCARRVTSAGEMTDTRGGTPMFMAPEAARGEAQGTAADIWALGCTVVEMATGGAAPWQPRFADPMAALRHVAASGEAPGCPAWMSDDARDFLARCFRRDPAERWTAEQLLRHRFVAAEKEKEKEPFVSPKSILDQAALWDDDNDSATACVTAGATTTASPTDRVRELSTVAAPEWTWDADWITVVVRSDDACAASPSTSSHSVARSSAPNAEQEAPVSPTTGHTTTDDDEDDTFRAGDHHVASDCNSLAITSNRFFLSWEKSRVTFFPLSVLVPAHVSHVPP